MRWFPTVFREAGYEACEAASDEDALEAAAIVGGTPMVALGRLAKELPGRIVAKLEMRNPGGRQCQGPLGVALM